MWIEFKLDAKLYLFVSTFNSKQNVLQEFLQKDKNPQQFGYETFHINVVLSEILIVLRSSAETRNLPSVWFWSWTQHKEPADSPPFEATLSSSSLVTLWAQITFPGLHALQADAFLHVSSHQAWRCRTGRNLFWCCSEPVRLKNRRIPADQPRQKRRNSFEPFRSRNGKCYFSCIFYLIRLIQNLSVRRER